MQHPEQELPARDPLPGIAIEQLDGVDRHHLQASGPQFFLRRAWSIRSARFEPKVLARTSRTFFTDSLLVRDPVVDPRAVAPSIDDAGRLGDAELARAVRLADPQRRLEVADAQLAVDEQRDDPDTRLVPERAEHAGQGTNIFEVRSARRTSCGRRESASAMTCCVIPDSRVFTRI